MLEGYRLGERIYWEEKEDAYEGDGLNLYAYCQNNPIVYYDPTGYMGQTNGDGKCKTPDGEKVEDTSRIDSRTLSEQIKEIQKKTPQQLLQEGWIDVINPEMAQNTLSRNYQDPKTGLRIRFDPKKPNTTGFEAVDHYHIYNPNYTKKKIDYYFDIDGNPVGKGSDPSHIVIQEEQTD